MSQLPPCSMLLSLSLYLREFSGEDVTKAFSEMVGRGSFGTVYKGEIGLTKVAVKLIDPVSVCLIHSFCAERSAKSARREVKELEKREERSPRERQKREERSAKTPLLGHRTLWCKTRL